MSRTHRFRIYFVEAYENRMSGNVPLSARAGGAMRNRVLSLMSELSQQGTIFQNPRPPRDGEPARAVASTTVGEPQVIRDDFIHLDVEMGEQGSHRRATRRGRPARDLSEWSPEMGYRLALLFPNAAQQRFMVVAEVIRGRDALERTLRLATKTDLARKKKHIEDAKTLAPDQRTPYGRLLFRAEQAPDEAYLEEILGGAKKASAVFVSTVPNARGRRSLIKRKLIIELRDGDRDIGRQIGGNWFRLQRQDHARTRAEGVSDLADQLEENNLIDGGESERYDEASINIVAENGDRTRIATDTLRDVFTYPVSDGYPPTGYFYDKVAPRVRTVARNAQFPVARINPSEVEEWLVAST